MEQLIKVFTALALAFAIMAVSLVAARKLAAWLDARKKKDNSEDNLIENKENEDRENNSDIT